jgi:hypothetical protein
MENEESLISILKKELSIDLAEKISLHEIKEKLTKHISYLITNNFQELINLLYRIDVNENKLRDLLKENSDADAANVIADLIIERQLQKIETRNKFKTKHNQSDEEKW